ncbi:MAG: DUF3857 domain-containing protein [Acidobacteriota bacterium]|nr:DUF3857 domain-containing protein [Acidobacteriota bacterium]
MNRIVRSVSQVMLLSVLLVVVRAVPTSATLGWLPISPEDLALKDNPKEPGADAMILYRESEVDARQANVSGDAVREYVRIKIFTQAGTKQGHIEIPYNKSWETIPYVSGRTILPDGTIKDFDGKVLDSTIVKTGGIKYFAKAFTLPDVQPGCIVEYKYDRQSRPGWVHDEGWVLSSDLYTREAHFTYYPNDVFSRSGFSARYRSYLLPKDAQMKQSANDSYSMAVNDVPAIVEEPLMPPRVAIEPTVEFYYIEPSDPDPGQSKEKYWGYFAKKWDSEIEHFDGKKDALNQEISKIVSPSDSPEAKLRKIYDRVEQIRNLSMEDYKGKTEQKAEELKADGNAADVLERGYATGHRVNLTFIGLARAAGFQATELYLAPRNAFIFMPDRNDRSEIEAEIVWVKAGSQEYYLDPSARYYPFGVLPWFETESGGVRVDGHTAAFVTTPNPQFSQATIARMADLTVHQDGSITGNIQIDFAGLEGAMERESNRKEDETGRTKNLEDEIKTWLPIGSDFEITKITNWDDIEQPLHVEATLKLPTYGSAAARSLLLPLDPFQATQAGFFSKQSRQNAIYFPYPYQEIDDVTVHAPAEYDTGGLPKPQKIDLGAALYEINATGQGNTVKVKRQLAIKGILFGKENYPTFRAFFGAVRTSDNAQMVLQYKQAGQLN